MIVVCGEALIDIVDGRATPGGSPFNTARALGRLGVPVAFLGRVSEDADGRRLLGVLEAEGVNLGLVSMGPEHTTTALARVDLSGRAEYEFVIDGTAAGALSPAMLPPHLEPGVEAICFGSLGLVLTPLASTLIGLIEREGSSRVVVLDPNIRAGLIPDAEYRARLKAGIGLSTIVKASDADVAWMYPGLDHEAAAERLLGEGVRLAVITLGARGAFAAHGRHRIEVPAAPVRIVDTIGAGDAFGAALLAWLHDHGALRVNLSLSEGELRGALEFACRAAAISCARAGADPPVRSEISG